MTKTIKIIVGIIIAIVVIGGIWWAVSKTSGPTETGPIKIGFIGPLTSDVAAIGQNVRASVELAVEQINEKGGINGRNLEVIYEDGVCNAKDTTNAANKLINVDRVPVIIGGLCSSETLAAAPMAERGKTVLFSPGSSNPDITNAGDYIFRDYPSDTFQGKKGAEIAYNNLGARNVAILYCLSDWCVGLDRVFEETFTKLGGTIVAEGSFEQKSRDLRTQLTKIKNADPDLVYFVAYTESTVNGLRQIKELGIETKILGADSWDDSTILEKAGDSAEGIMYTMPFSPLTDEFKTAMEAKTGSTEVTIGAPQAYDAVNIIADIMRKVGTDSTKIKDELYKVEGYEGVSGIITLDENGDLATGNYIIKTVKDGKQVPYEK